MRENIVVLDFGGQYNQLIARRVRECNVYCEVHPYTISMDELKALAPSGIILTGGPNSVYGEDSPQCNPEVFKLGIPVLGICYGAQLLAHQLGGKVATAPVSEYGRTEVTVDDRSGLLSGLGVGGPETTGCGRPGNTIMWMSHTDYIETVPSGFKVTAHTPVCPVAAMENAAAGFYATQFHPEVMHSVEGFKMLQNFVLKVCGCKGDWTPASFIDTTIEELRAEVGDDKVILGLSGGVDSTVAAVLLNKAIGHNLTCIFVNNGLLRKNEFEDVMNSYKDMGLNVIGVDASKEFISELKGVTEPEAKRKIIGRLFVETFDKYAQTIENAKWLAQGTIYPDVIESAGIPGIASKIKSHHNVGGLPEKMHLKIVEPLKMLFKDEVRRVGRSLGIKEELVGRHPFPGPSLAIRIIGDVTEEKLRVLREADDIFISGLTVPVWASPPHQTRASWRQIFTMPSGRPV